MKLVLDNGKEIQLSKETSERLQKELGKPKYEGNLFIGKCGPKDRLIIKVTPQFKEAVCRSHDNCFIGIDTKGEVTLSGWKSDITPDCGNSYTNIKPLFGETE